MARAISNVVIATDSFATWVGITNQMADAFTNQALTANNSTSGATVSGNSALTGTFEATTLAAGSVLRGGTVSTSANLNVTSNVIFTGPTINATSNVNITTTNTYVNSAVTYVVGGLANVTSNVSVTNTNTYINSASVYVNGGAANITSNVSVTNANTYVNSAVVYVNGGLANVTSNVSVVAANVTANVTNFTIRAGTLTVDSNVSVTNTVTIANNLTLGGTSHTVAGNVAFDTATLFVDATNNRVGLSNDTPDATLSVTGTANVSGAVRLAGALTVVGLSTLASANVTGTANVATANVTTLNATNVNTSGNTTLQSDVVLAVIANTDLGTTTASPVEVFNFPVATYTGAKITAKIASLSGANAQVQELIIAQNTTDVVLTVYGTVAAPASANLGVFSASINTTAVSVKFQQTGANSSVKLFTQLIK